MDEINDGRYSKALIFGMCVLLRNHITKHSSNIRFPKYFGTIENKI